MNKNQLTKIISIIALLAISFSAPLFLNSVYWVSVLILMAINILLVSSLRTLSLLGQYSLGHVGFMLIGAYTSALLVMRVGLPFSVALVLAGLLSGCVALILGYPFLRVKGVYFSLLTLLTAEIFRLVAWNWNSVTGGTKGLIHIPPPGGLGIIDFSNVNNYYYLTLSVVVLSLLVIFRLEESPLGFKWRAIQDADNLAQVVGINIMQYKIINFATASFFAGIAGSLFAHFQHALSTDATSRFGVVMSLYLIIYMVVGGQGKFTGPIIGVFVLTMISEFARPLGQYQPMLIGAIAILTMFLMPEGLVGLPGQFRLGYKKIWKQLRR